MTAYLIVRAEVGAADRSAFDAWYEAEHLPDAMRAFGTTAAQRGWSDVNEAEHLPDAMRAFGTTAAQRGWSDVTEGVHIAIYTFRDLDHARAIAADDGSPAIRALIAEFDRVWQGRVTRTREIVAVAQTLTTTTEQGSTHA